MRITLKLSTISFEFTSIRVVHRTKSPEQLTEKNNEALSVHARTTHQGESFFSHLSNLSDEFVDSVSEA